jgi:hypothetical protein
LSERSLVHLIRLLNEVVGAVACFEPGTNQVEESGEAELEGVCRGSLKLGVDKTQNGAKVLVDDGTSQPC